MNVTVIGTGYVGLTTGVALAYVGHDVTCVDKNPSIVERLQRGESTIHEPGLDALLAASARRLTFTTELPVLQGEAVAIIAVGTPSRDDGDADMAYVDAAATELAQQIQPGARVVIANKSTVPIGSAQHVDALVRRVLRERGVEAEVDVVSNSEFLAEGRAVRDSLYPDRIVVGADRPEAIDVIRSAGIPFVDVPEDFTAEGIGEAVDAVADALDVEEKGEALRAEISVQMDRLADTVSQIDAKKRVLFILSMQDGRIMASGTGTAANGIIELAGAENAIVDYEGYKQLTDEAIITLNPDVILMMDREGELDTPPETVLVHPAIATTQAAKDKALIRMDGLYLLGFGPRTASAALDLAKALYGDDIH